MRLTTRLRKLEAAYPAGEGCEACRDARVPVVILRDDEPEPPPPVCERCGRELPTFGIRFIRIVGVDSDDV